MKSEASEHDRLTSRVSTQARKYLRCWCQAGKAEIPVATSWISLFQSNHWISHWSCSPTAALDLIDICLVDAPYVTAHCGLYAGFWANKELREQSVQVPSQFLEGGINCQMHQWCPCWSKSHSCFSIYIYIIDMCVCAFYYILQYSSMFYHYILVSSRWQLERCLMIAASNVQIMQPLRPF